MKEPAPIQLLDVHELEPPEPLTRILAALQNLPQETILKVRHRREPHPLYAMLSDRKLAHRCLKISDDEYRIYIWQAGNPVLESRCQADIAQEKQP